MRGERVYASMARLRSPGSAARPDAENPGRGGMFWNDGGRENKGQIPVFSKRNTVRHTESKPGTPRAGLRPQGMA